MNRRIAVASLALVFGTRLGAQESRIPFERGLTLTYASALTGRPDFEHRVSLAVVDGSGAAILGSWSSTSANGTVNWHQIQRRLPNVDRLQARSFHVYGNTRDATDYAGSAYYMASVAIVDELRRLGRSSVLFLAPSMSPAPYSGMLERSRPESIEVLVNGRRTTLRGIRAQGTLVNYGSPQPETRMSFLFLDDSVAPWILMAEAVNAAGQGRRQLVQITYPEKTSTVSAELEKSCRATVYGIHFASGSADLDSASAPTLATIARAMTEHGDWRLTIVGHTDSIGTVADNLNLSRRRAERVRLALTGDHRVAGGRLQADGKGEGQPVDDNGSLQGRARNRRVELLRGC